MVVKVILVPCFAVHGGIVPNPISSAAVSLVLLKVILFPSCNGLTWYNDVAGLGSPDGKYILTGGEDDLVQVWSMEDQAVVAWGEGHNSWVLDHCLSCLNLVTFLYLFGHMLRPRSHGRRVLLLSLLWILTM